METFFTLGLFCQKLTSDQICFQVEMKDIARTYLTTQCRFFVWLDSNYFVWGGDNIFRSMFN